MEYRLTVYFICVHLFTVSSMCMCTMKGYVSNK
jgi:hypothetical protein